MELPTSESLLKPMTASENLIKPVPKPFSIEALMSDSGPKRSNPTPWEMFHNQHRHVGKDTDSEGSLDMDLVQDLSSRRCEKDGK